MPELMRMKQELRWREKRWLRAHNKVTKTSYRMFMKNYEMTAKATKKSFNAASIISANSHPGQLFRKIWSLTALPQSKPNNRELETTYDTFVNHFADKILSL